MSLPKVLGTFAIVDDDGLLEDQWLEVAAVGIKSVWFSSKIQVEMLGFQWSSSRNSVENFVSRANSLFHYLFFSGSAADWVGSGAALIGEILPSFLEVDVSEGLPG